MIPKKNPKADYSRYSLIFFQLGLIIMLTITYFSLEWRSYERDDNFMDALSIDKIIEEEIPIVNLNTPPPPPPPTAAPEVLKIVENIAEVEETVVQSTETSQNEKVEIVSVASVKVEEQEEEITVPFAVIEQAPIYPGCENAPKKEQRDCFQQKIEQHVRDNFTYPQVALELGIQGRVYVLFEIDKDGSVINLKFRAPDKNLEQEARRIISKLPKFIPGKQRGKPVKVAFSIPINFTIQNQ
ncbi:MAG: energy transducer TonB [Flavobacteriales bacterium CG_4_9_14_3_um_filter_40_17]|nr:MAG: energy transducer TonB [Flavobacteriales bacterium CG_4_9_14_3_um_filter_40_17]